MCWHLSLPWLLLFLWSCWIWLDLFESAPPGQFPWSARWWAHVARHGACLLRGFQWRDFCVHFCVFSLISLKLVNLIINHSKKMWRAIWYFSSFGLEENVIYDWRWWFYVCKLSTWFFQKLAGHYNILYHSGSEIYAMWLTILAATSIRRMRIMMIVIYGYLWLSMVIYGY